MKKIQYYNDDDKNIAIKEMKGKDYIVIEEQNIVDGNFLIFQKTEDVGKEEAEDREFNPMREIEMLKEQIIDLQNYIVEQEYERLLSQGGL